jgi:hypothetical protein
MERGRYLHAHFEGQAQRAALDQVERYIELLKADAALVCLSDAKRNWRKKVFPEYKANRKNVAGPSSTIGCGRPSLIDLKSHSCPGLRR